MSESTIVERLTLIQPDWADVTRRSQRLRKQHLRRQVAAHRRRRASRSRPRRWRLCSSSCDLAAPQHDACRHRTSGDRGHERMRRTRALHASDAEPQGSQHPAVDGGVLRASGWERHPDRPWRWSLATIPAVGMPGENRATRRATTPATPTEPRTLFSGMALGLSAAFGKSHCQVEARAPSPGATGLAR